MESLPRDVFLKICEFLPRSTLAMIAPVNKRWQLIATTVLYTTIEHTDWKPRRVSKCLEALSSSHAGILSTVVRHLDLSLWSIDPAFSLLLIEALMQTKFVLKLRLTMSETFAQHFDMHLIEHGIIAHDVVDEAQSEMWYTEFLPHLQELELSSSYNPFRLAAGRPVRCVSSPTHMQYPALQCLLPFLRRSLGPIHTMHFNLTVRNSHIASKALKMTSQMLPYLTHVFFNFFVSKRINKYTPDLLEDLSTLTSLRSVELLLSRSARSSDPFLYSHFAALHTLKATAIHLTQVIIDTIRWKYRARDCDDTNVLYGWSPLPSDVRTHGWWLEQYGSAPAAHAAMLILWNDSECSIPLLHEIGRSMSTNDYINIQ